MACPLMFRERFLLAVATATIGAVTPSFGADAPNDPVCVYARNSCAIDVIERRFAVLVSDRAATTDQSAGGISRSISLLLSLRWLEYHGEIAVEEDSCSGMLLLHRCSQARWSEFYGFRKFSAGMYTSKCKEKIVFRHSINNALLRGHKFLQISCYVRICL